MDLKLGEQYRDKESGFVGSLIRRVFNEGDPRPRVVLERSVDGEFETWEGPESRLEPAEAAASTSSKSKTKPFGRED